MTSIDAVVAAGSRPLARPLRRARGGSRRSGSGTRHRRCSLPAAGSPSSRPSATASIFASASGGTAATPAARSRSGRARASSSLRPDALYDLAFRLEENHWNGTVAPQLVVRRVFATAPRYRELREWLAEEWRKPAAARDRKRRRSLRSWASRTALAATSSSRPASARSSRRSRRSRTPRDPARPEDDWPAILEVHRAAFGEEDVAADRRRAARARRTSTSRSSPSSPRRTASSSGTS